MIAACVAAGMALGTALANPPDQRELRTGPRLQFEPYSFTNAKGESVPAEIGRLVVPENHGRPGGRLIRLAFVRFRSTSPHPGPPIVYLAGGPGGSAIALAKGPRHPSFMAMRAFGDVIALDQRGAGMSQPALNCPGGLGRPLEEPGDPERLLLAYRKASRACADHWRGEGVDLSQYNTAASADDLEALRLALGTRKIVLWGSSYGTHLAFAAARRHPNSIDRMVLLGVEGPDHTLKLPSEGDAMLVRLSRIAAADPILSSRMPDLLGLVQDTWRRLEKSPERVELKDPAGRPVLVALGKFDLQVVTFGLLGFRDGQTSLPALYEALRTHDQTAPALLEAAAQVVSERRGSIGSAMGYVMDCASSASRARLARIVHEERTSIFGSASNFPMPMICADWGIRPLPGSFRSRLRSRVPVLFLSGSADARTPPSNVEDLRPGFPNSRHIIIEGAGHGHDLFVSSPEIDRAIAAFMQGRPQESGTIRLPPLRFDPIGPVRTSFVRQP